MSGWFKRMFRREDMKPVVERDIEVIKHLNRAQKEIERSKRLLRSSGYYNDRLEGTHENSRVN